MGLKVRLAAVGQNEASVAESIVKSLNSTRLLSMSCVSNGKPWINNAYFAYSSDLKLFVLTPPSTRHAKALELSKDVAVAICDSQQTGDGGKLGIQATGAWNLATNEDLAAGIVAYRSQFPAMAELLQSEKTMVESGMESRIFMITLDKIIIFDEFTFGNEVWVDVEVRR